MAAKKKTSNAAAVAAARAARKAAADAKATAAKAAREERARQKAIMIARKRVNRTLAGLRKRLDVAERKLAKAQLGYNNAREALDRANSQQMV